MDGDNKATIIDAAAEIEGKLRGKDAQILGRFKGEVELKGNLVLGEGAKVEALVLADSAEIAGEYEGDLQVKRLVLLEKAKVTGTLDAQILAVREGAVINGTVTAGETEKKPAPKAEAKPEPKADAKPPVSPIKPGAAPGSKPADPGNDKPEPSRAGENKGDKPTPGTASG